MADYVTKNGEVWITKKIYKNQPLLLSAMPTGVDLTNVMTLVVKYEKPNGDTGQFTGNATIDSPATNQTFTYQIAASTLDQTGGEQNEWLIWAYATDSNGSYPGTPIHLPVFAEGRE